jgi:hypothetical protein
VGHGYLDSWAAGIGVNLQLGMRQGFDDAVRIQVIRKAGLTCMV